MEGMRVLASGLRFPEGPVAAKDGSVYVVEIVGGTVAQIGADGAVTRIAVCGGGPNGLAIGPDGALYVCNNGGLQWEEKGGVIHPIRGTPESYVTGSIQRVDPRTGLVTQLYDRCGEYRLYAPNDLVFDRSGGFYFTDFGKARERDRDIGSIYYARSDGSMIEEIVHPIANPNGIGLSPDQCTLYVAETETSRVWAYDIVEPGIVKKMPYPSPNGGRLICGLPGYQRFDSLGIQANGDICVATLVTGRITVISPKGAVIREVPMPDHHTTNICFGGEDLRTAYITQSTLGLLIEMPWPESGLRLNFEI